MITAPQKTNIIQLGITLRTVCTYVRYMPRKNLTFPRNFVVVPRGHPRMVVRNDADLLQGGRGSSARADTNFDGMAETSVQQQCKDRERHREDRSNYHCRIR